MIYNQYNLPPIEERFWALVDKTDGCWNWTGYLQDGRGRMRFRGRLVLAPRIAWELTNGPIPQPLFCLHKCDNPRIVNPDHLYLGTKLDNARDRESRGRGGDHRGTANGRAKLTPELVAQIRAEYASLPHGGLLGRGRVRRVRMLLAEKYGVSYDAVYFAVSRKTWDSVA